MTEDNDLNEENTQEEEEEFEKRFNNLDISDSRELWNRLSDSEKQQFDEWLKSGKIGDLIEVWNPWWMSSDKDSNRLVQPLDEMPSTHSSTEISRLPDLMTNINKLNELISVCIHIYVFILNNLF